MFPIKPNRNVLKSCNQSQKGRNEVADVDVAYEGVVAMKQKVAAVPIASDMDPSCLTIRSSSHESETFRRSMNQSLTCRRTAGHIACH